MVSIAVVNMVEVDMQRHSSSSTSSKEHRDIPIYLDQHLHILREEVEPPTPKGQSPDRQQRERAHVHPPLHLVAPLPGGGEKRLGFVSGSALSPPNTQSALGDHLEQGPVQGTLQGHLHHHGAASNTSPDLTSNSLISSWRSPYLTRPLPPPPTSSRSSSNKSRTTTTTVVADASPLSSSSTTVSSFSAASRLDLASSSSSSSSSSSASFPSSLPRNHKGDHFILHDKNQTTTDTPYPTTDIATKNYHYLNNQGRTATGTGTAAAAAAIFAPLVGAQPIKSSNMMMMDRPSTSGGPTRKKPFMVSDYSTFSNHSTTAVASGTSRADKRLSKDDLFLVSKPSLLSRFQSFRVPTRGRLPTPDPSPRSESPMSAEPEVPIMVRLHTPDSLHAPRMPAAMQSEVSIGMAMGSPIGMALGSPSHPPTEAWEDPWNSQPTRQLSPMPRQPQFQLPLSQSPLLSPVSTDVASPQPTLSRRGKWKMFGMFGSKKNKSERSNSKKGREHHHVVQQQIIGSSASIGPYATGAVPARSKTLGDRKSPKYKPIVVRSNTVSDGSGSGSSTEAWNPPPMPQATLQVPIINSLTSTAARTTGGRMLDVDIPSVHMERYSVMFSNVLGPPRSHGQHQQPPQLGSAPSLLARRQATLDRLKNISDRVEEECTDSNKTIPRPIKVVRKPVPASAFTPAAISTSAPGPTPIQTVRRATSPLPQAAKSSPAFSLFPAPPSSRPRNLNMMKDSSDHGGSNLRSRSNTAPSALASPNQENFDISTLRKEVFNNSTVSLALLNSGSNPSPISTRGRVNEFPLPRPSPGRPNISTPTRTTTTARTLTANDKANASTLSLATSVSKFTPDQSSLMLDSPTSISFDALDVVHAGPRKPVLNEPKWTMISPLSSNPTAAFLSATATATAAGSSSSAASVMSTTSTVTTATNRKRSPSSVSSAKTHLTQPSIVSIDEDDSLLKAAVEISIARQISISRQQRNLLRPLKTTMVGSGIRRFNTIAGTTSPGKSPSAATGGVFLGDNERLSETNTSTPILVHPEGYLPVQVRGHQYKKSEIIVIEGS